HKRSSARSWYPPRVRGGVLSRTRFSFPPPHVVCYFFNWLPDLVVAKAINSVVVDHADGLHHCVTNCRTHKLESALEQVFAHGVGVGRARGNFFERTPGILFRRAADELPDVSVEAAKFLLHCQKRFRVLNRRGDLEPVADNPRIGEESLHFAHIVTGDFLRSEVVEDFAVMLALLKNRVPAQPGLRAFE